VRSTLGRDLLHARVLDSALLAKEEDLVSESVDFLLEPDASVEAVRGNAAGVGQRHLSK
jgi:hypothetical protein